MPEINVSCIRSFSNCHFQTINLLFFDEHNKYEEAWDEINVYMKAKIMYQEILMKLLCPFIIKLLLLSFDFMNQRHMADAE